MIFQPLRDTIRRGGPHNRVPGCSHAFVCLAVQVPGTVDMHAILGQGLPGIVTCL